MTSFSASGAKRRALPDPQTIVLLWFAFFGLVLFATVLLWQFGVWHLLLGADPTMLTLVIMLIFLGSTLWCGRRAYTLALQRQGLLQFSCRLREQPQQLTAWLEAEGHEDDWVHAYFGALWRKGERHWRDNGQLTDLLAEQAHGPHETAWWVNGIQLKLGLLGKVIGFSVLALHIGSMDSFDASQSQQLLKSLTGGLGIALLTTMTGLVANMLLGLQLTRLDREADALVSQALALAERELHKLFPGA